MFLASQRSLPGTENLVFECFQLGRNITFNRFQSLASDVFNWNRAALAFTDFNVKPMNPVIGDFQRFDSGIALFPGLQVDQKLIRVSAQIA